MTILGSRARGVLRGSSAGIQFGERPARPAQPRTRDGVDERLAFILLFAIACGIPVFARWRSDEHD
jgi:hypothetical protein